MLEIGAQPIDFTLNKYNTGNVTLSSHAKNTILLSFVDIDHSWDWLQELIEIKKDAGSPQNLQVIAVLFKFKGTITKEQIEERIKADKIIKKSDIDFPILVDNPWGPSSLARQYQEEGFINDPVFSGNTGNSFWSCVISPEYQVTDKWNLNSTANEDPVSFNRRKASGSRGFNSADFRNARSFLLQRLADLNEELRIIAIDPFEGTSVKELRTIDILFSKPLADTANLPESYSIGGGRVGTLSVNTVDYIGSNKIENLVTLGLTGSPADNTQDDTIVLSIDRNTVTGITGDQVSKDQSSITYIADLSGPKIVSITPPPRTIIGPVRSMTIHITFNEEVVGALRPGTFSVSPPSVDWIVDNVDQDPSDCNSYIVDISGPDLDPDQAITLNIAGITDLAGYALAVMTPISYTANPRALEVLAVPSPDGTGMVDGKRVSDLQRIQLNFSETIKGIDSLEGASLTGKGKGSLKISSISPDEDGHSTYTLLLEGVPGNGKVSIDLRGITGKSGQPPAGGAVSYTAQKPREVVLVLDSSGSMNEAGKAGKESKSKIEYLQDAVCSFFHKWNEYATNGDRAGIIYFSNKGIMGHNLMPILPGVNVDTLINQVTSQSASGSSALGAGLAMAFDLLKKTPAQAEKDRSIILFTDGIQNMSPIVVPRQNGQAAITSAAALLPDSGYPKEKLPIEIDPGIAVHTIGVGDYSHNLDTLFSLSASTGGLFHCDDPAHLWPALENSLDNTLVDIYRGSSLQIVSRNTGVLSKGLETESFLINSSVNKLSISISWSGDVPLSCKLVSEDGISVPFDRVIEEPNYRIASINFPHYQLKKPRGIYHGRYSQYREERLKVLAGTGTGSTESRKRTASNLATKPPKDAAYTDSIQKFIKEIITAEGNWKVVIERKFPGDNESPVPVPYNIVILADDKTLKYDFTRHNKILKTGDSIPVDISVQEYNTPVQRVYAAEASIQRSYEKMGSLLAKKNPAIDKKLAPILKSLASGTSKEKKDADIMLSGADHKLRLLMTDSKTAEKARKPHETNIKLSSLLKRSSSGKMSGMGSFQEILPEVSIPGIYRVDYKIRGAGRRCGVFERIETRSFIVTVKPEAEFTRLNAKYSDKESTFEMTITPEDRFGNLLGPGYKDSIECSISGKAVTEISDNLTGSYSIIIGNLKRDDLTLKRVELKVLGENLINEAPINILPAKMALVGGSGKTSAKAKSAGKKPAPAKGKKPAAKKVAKKKKAAKKVKKK